MRIIEPTRQPASTDAGSPRPHDDAVRIDSVTKRFGEGASLAQSARERFMSI